MRGARVCRNHHAGRKIVLEVWLAWRRDRDRVYGHLFEGVQAKLSDQLDVSGKRLPIPPQWARS